MGRKSAEADYEPDWVGAPMFWSTFDAEANQRMVIEARFDLESADLRTRDNPFGGGTETFLWVVASRA